MRILSNLCLIGALSLAFGCGGDPSDRVDLSVLEAPKAVQYAAPGVKALSGVIPFPKGLYTQKETHFALADFFKKELGDNWDDRIALHFKHTPTSMTVYMVLQEVNDELGEIAIRTALKKIGSGGLDGLTS